ncbi:MAG: hypothetical protein ACREDE_03120, partial [Thermoplasmata archaeon]
VYGTVGRWWLLGRKAPFATCGAHNHCVAKVPTSSHRSTRNPEEGNRGFQSTSGEGVAARGRGVRY